VIKVGKNETFKTIHEAVYSAQRGSVILVEEGIYASNSTIRIDGKHHITIEGKGRVQINCLEPQFAVIFIEKSSNISIKNIRAKHLNNPDYANVCSGAVIWIDESSDVNIEGCELNGCGTFGVDIINSRSITVKNNDIHHNSIAGVRVVKHIDVSVLNNTIRDNAAAIAVDTGTIALVNVNENKTGLIVKNNNLKNNGTKNKAKPYVF